MVSVSRRTLAKGAAWSVPAVVATATVPAYAASSTICPDSQYAWYVKSRIVATDPDYSNTNYDAKITLGSLPRGAAEMQHWASNGQLNWRLMLGFPDGAAAGTMITIPVDPSWHTPSQPTVLNLAHYYRFDGKNPELYTRELPVADITVGASEILIVISEAIPAGAAGGFVFTAQVDGGQAAIDAGTVYTAEGFINFWPVGCPAMSNPSI